MTFFVTLTSAGKPTKFDSSATTETADPGAVEMSDDVALALAAQQADHHYDLSSGMIVPDEEVELSKDDLYAYVRSKSYSVRMGGVKVGELQVKTDTDTLALVNSLWNSANDDSSGIFYFDPGQGDLVKFTAAEAISFCRDYSKAIISMYKVRNDVSTAVGAGTVTTLAEIDSALTATN